MQHGTVCMYRQLLYGQRSRPSAVYPAPSPASCKACVVKVAVGSTGVEEREIDVIEQVN